MTVKPIEKLLSGKKRERQWRDGFHTDADGKQYSLDEMNASHLSRTIILFKKQNLDTLPLEKERRKRAAMAMKARIEKYNERMLTVIKSHLGCEDFLNGLLSAAGRRWKGKMFNGKFDIAKQINPPEIEGPIWTLMDSGNKLRNAVAHGHEESKITMRMTEFRKAWLASMSPEQAEGVKDLDDIRMVISAFADCGGYLVVAAEGEKRRLEEKQAKKKQSGVERAHG